jgi:hypothetical protein
MAEKKADSGLIVLSQSRWTKFSVDIIRDYTHDRGSECKRAWFRHGDFSHDDL